MLTCQSFYLLYYALNTGQNESYKKAKLRLFRKCFGNSATEFSLQTNLNFNLLSRIQEP